MRDATSGERRPPFGLGRRDAILAAYALLLVPAVVGAALDWPWALTFVLMAPSFALNVRLGSVGFRRARGHSIRGWLVGVGGATTGVILAATLPGRYAGLVLAGCAITAELVVRAWRSRHRDTEARTPVA